MMNPKFWKNWSIASRISAVISAGIVIGAAVIIIVAARYLKSEHIATFSRQQFATLQALAMHLDADLTSKLKVIKQAADSIPPQPLADTSVARQLLAGIAPLFDQGLMILAPDGRLLAELPAISADGQQKDPASAPFHQQAGTVACPVISKIFYSPQSDHGPMVGLTAPIQDSRGNIAGYVCGGISLKGDNPLANIARLQMGGRGGASSTKFSRDRTAAVRPSVARDRFFWHRFNISRRPPGSSPSMFPGRKSWPPITKNLVCSSRSYCLAALRPFSCAGCCSPVF
ncbi:MAG: PDC sensor domain-containing protein [Rhodoferax sp.]|nr:PDC sensor domain-containing protein [Rhodoferax sp.]